MTPTSRAEMKPDHSPLPWRYDAYMAIILDANGNEVPLSIELMPALAREKANMEVVVASVNSRAELVEALRKAVRAMDEMQRSALGLRRIMPIGLKEDLDGPEYVRSWLRWRWGKP